MVSNFNRGGTIVNMVIVSIGAHSERYCPIIFKLSICPSTSAGLLRKFIVRLATVSPCVKVIVLPPAAN